MIVLTITIQGDEFPKDLLLSKEYHYKDLDEMSLSDDSLSYRLVEIASEELEKLKQKKHQEENPELYDGKAPVTNSNPF